MKNTDKIATILGSIIAGLLAFQEATNVSNGLPINWVNVGVSVAVAALGYYTNKLSK